mgnify:CR=1 FL=1
MYNNKQTIPLWQQRSDNSCTLSFGNRVQSLRSRETVRSCLLDAAAGTCPSSCAMPALSSMTRSESPDMYRIACTTRCRFLFFLRKLKRLLFFAFCNQYIGHNYHNTSTTSKAQSAHAQLQKDKYTTKLLKYKANVNSGISGADNSGYLADLINDAEGVARDVEHRPLVFTLTLLE